MRKKVSGERLFLRDKFQNNDTFPTESWTYKYAENYVDVTQPLEIGMSVQQNDVYADRVVFWTSVNIKNVMYYFLSQKLLVMAERNIIAPGGKLSSMSNTICGFRSQLGTPNQITWTLLIVSTKQVNQIMVVLA